MVFYCFTRTTFCPCDLSTFYLSTFCLLLLLTKIMHSIVENSFHFILYFC